MPKGQKSLPTEGINFEQVLIGKIEQHNVVIDSIKNVQKNVLEANYIKSISYGRVNDEQKYTTLARKSNLQNCDFGLQMSLIRFNFQNNNGNPSSGELYYNPQSGQPSSKDTTFRGSHRSGLRKKVFLKFLAKFTGRPLCRSLFFQASGL